MRRNSSGPSLTLLSPCSQSVSVASSSVGPSSVEPWQKKWMMCGDSSALAISWAKSNGWGR